VGEGRRTRTSWQMRSTMVGSNWVMDSGSSPPSAPHTNTPQHHNTYRCHSAPCQGEHPYIPRAQLTTTHTHTHALGRSLASTASDKPLSSPSAAVLAPAALVEAAAPRPPRPAPRPPPTLDNNGGTNPPRLRVITSHRIDVTRCQLVHHNKHTRHPHVRPRSLTLRTRPAGWAAWAAVAACRRLCPQ